MKRARIPTLVALSVLVSGLVVAPGQVSARSPAERPGPLDQSPAAVAERTGQPVEIAAATTETTRILANPNGTKTLEQHVLPVRARKGDGWAPIDTTLTVEPDGRVRPRTTVVGLTLSGGGTGPLVTITHDGKAMSLSWPAALPAPRVAGDTATYPSVLPGVDLQVRAEAEGFSQLLVVHTARAAANPALRTLHYRTAATGLTLHTSAQGATTAVDRAGATVFVSAAPTMWDSPTATAPAQIRRMGVQVAGRQLTISPDRGLLTDKHAHYPLYIDPSFALAENLWTQVNALDPNKSYWDLLRDSARVGEYPSLSYRMRSLFQIDLAPIVGTVVTSATFDITLDHSWACVPTPVWLYHVGVVLDPTKAVTYNNTASYWTPYLDEKSANANEQGGCSGGVQPDKLMEFGGTALLNSVQAVANGGAGHTETFGLRAKSETDDAQWKRFLPTTAKLLVVYDTVPRPPVNLSTVPPTPCGTATAPTALNTASPTFSAVASDPDGDNISTRLEIRKGDTVLGSVSSATIDSGAAFGFPAVPAGLLPADQPGTVFNYRASSTDAPGYAGPATDPCYFTVDTMKPAAPGISSADYPDGVAVKSAGQAGTVTFTRAAADTDVAGFRYGFQQDRLTMYAPADSTGRAIVPITLWPQNGSLDRLLYAKAVDRAGNISSTTPSWKLTANPREVTAPPVRADVNGDGQADITAVFDQGDGRTAVWNTMSNNTQPYIAWDSGIDGGFPMYRTKSVSGDFNGDGLSDTALLREDPDQAVRLYILSSDGNGFSASGAAWASTAFRLSHLLLAAGDFNGDGSTDLALLQGYAGAQTKLWVLFSDQGTFSDPVLQWDSGAGNLDVETVNIVAGDFNGDGTDDLAEFRGDAASATHAEMWVHSSNGAQLGTPQHIAPVNGTPWRGAQYLAVNVDGDASGQDEIVGFYDQGNASTQMWQLTRSAAGWSIRTAWDSGAAGSFDASHAVFLAGDYDGNGTDDLATFYDIGGGRRGLDVFASTGSGYAAPETVWQGTFGDKPTPVYVEPGHRYRLYPQHSGKCAEIPAGRTDNGAQLRQWDCVNGEANQQFVLRRIGSTPYFRIEVQSTGKCLDIAAWDIGDNVSVRQWTCDPFGWPQTNQEFWLEYVQGTGLDVVVRPRIVVSSKCLNVTGSSLANGATIVQYACAATPQPNQQFYLRPEP